MGEPDRNPDDPQSVSCPADLLLQIDRWCDEFERELIGGNSPRLEEYVVRMIGAQRSVLLRELLKVEIEFRRDKRDLVLQDDYRKRFPDDVNVIERLFGNDDEQLGQTIIGMNSKRESPHAGTRVRYFGEYELLEEIARGGMGVVWKARQSKLNRIVALKMILAGQLASTEDVQRFYTEAEAAARLDHPGIVPIYEIGLHEGQHYFSMAFIDGQSLKQRLADGPLRPREGAGLIRTIAEAVSYAHECGIVHRDLKPANVLLDLDNQPRVTDFGLAKQLESGIELTVTGQILGTPSYMPPEQAMGRVDQIGPLADVYSLGAVLYCVLTGRPPFLSANVADTLRQVIDEEPVAVRSLNSGVPVDLETICMKCLQKSPEMRYSSARDLCNDLQRFLDGDPIQARRVSQIRLAWRWVQRHPEYAGLIGFALAGVNLAAFRWMMSISLFDFLGLWGFIIGIMIVVFLAVFTFTAISFRLGRLEDTNEDLRTELDKLGRSNEQLKLELRLEGVMNEIHTAFADVGLEDGISLHEADVIDHYGTEEERLAARQQDEHEDWRRIPFHAIEDHPDSLCFMDVKGLRFHLPAFMCFALRRFRSSNSRSIDVTIHRLCDTGQISALKRVLTKQQQRVICAFLSASHEISADSFDISSVGDAIHFWQREGDA